MNAPTVTMQTAKNNCADSSSGRFQKTRAPIAKISSSCRNHTQRSVIGPRRRTLNQHLGGMDGLRVLISPRDLDRAADLVAQAAQRANVIRITSSRGSQSPRSTAASPRSRGRLSSRRNRPGISSSTLVPNMHRTPIVPIAATCVSTATE